MNIESCDICGDTANGMVVDVPICFECYTLHCDVSRQSFTPMKKAGCL